MMIYIVVRTRMIFLYLNYVFFTLTAKFSNDLGPFRTKNPGPRRSIQAILG